MSTEDEVVAIYSGVRGYLDKLAVSDVGRFEASLLSDLRAKQPDLLRTIVTDKQITPATEEKLKAFLDAFAKTFV
jgi:F-type H+-transporting ATPase subunit alpha